MEHLAEILVGRCAEAAEAVAILEIAFLTRMWLIHIEKELGHVGEFRLRNVGWLALLGGQYGCFRA